MIWRCGETVGSHCSDRSQRSGDGLCGVHNGLRLLLRLRRRLLRRRPLQAWCGRERCAGAHVQLVAELQYLAHGLHTHMHTSMVLARYVSTYACTCYTYTHAYVHVHPCVCACASHVHVHVHVRSMYRTHGRSVLRSSFANGLGRPGLALRLLRLGSAPRLKRQRCCTDYRTFSPRF